MRSKKVLIIAFHAPPIHFSAANRVRGLLKYLPEFGWTPTVLTRERSGPIKESYADSIVQTSYPGNINDLLRKRIPFISDQYSPKESPYVSQGNQNQSTRLTPVLQKGYHQLKPLLFHSIAYPDAQKLWKSYAIEQAEKLLDNGGYNAIISTSPPATDHLIAYHLVKEYDCSWIADYRDLWTQYHYNDYNLVREFFETRLEKKTINQADHLTAATEPFADRLQELHRKSTSVIYNGFDEKGTLPVSDDFTLTYTGSLIRGKRDPTKLFEAINNLKQQNIIDSSKVTVKFIGNYSHWVTNLVEQYELEELVVQPGRLPKNEVLDEQKRSQILLSIQWDHPMERMVCPGKIFEYLGAQRPILAYGGPVDSVVGSILDRTHAGLKVSSTDEIERYLQEKYIEYEEKGEVNYHGNQKEIDKFHHKEMAKHFAKVLDKQYDK